MSDQGRVFVTQEQAHLNYAQAEEYGDVVFCSMDDIPTVKGSLRTGKYIEEIRKRMAEYQPGVDYLMPAGSPVNIATVMMLAGRIGSTHNILKWDNRSHTYSKVVLEVPLV